MRRPLVAATTTACIALCVGAFVLYERSRNHNIEIATRTEWLLIRPHSPVIGPSNARVTIVEFFDPASDACRAAFPLLMSLLASNREDLRLVLRYTAFRPSSGEAIRILEAARRQDLLVPVLEALLDRQDEWAGERSPNFAWTIAATAGLDLDRARADAISAGIDAILRQDAEDVVAAHIADAPTFYVNGTAVTSMGLPRLLEVVEAALATTTMAP